MTHEVRADRDASFAFLCQFYEPHRSDEQTGLVLIKNGETVAAVTYDEYNGHNIFMHVAGKPGSRWMTRWFLHEAFKYPFISLGVSRITGWVEANNIDARRFVTHLGFKQEATLHGAASDGGDVILYVMFKEDCRYA